MDDNERRMIEKAGLTVEQFEKKPDAKEKQEAQIFYTAVMTDTLIEDGE